MISALLLSTGNLAWFDSWVADLDKWQIVLVWLTTLSGWGAWLYRKARDRRFRTQTIRQMNLIGKSDSVAVLIRVGGAGNPVPDVQQHLQLNCPGTDALLVYDMGGHIEGPEEVSGIVDDIQEGLRDLVLKGTTKPILLFSSGMIPFLFLVGAQLGNTSVVHVHQWDGTGYKCLYTYDPQSKTRKRLSRPKRSWKTLEMAAKSLESEVVRQSIEQT